MHSNILHLFPEVNKGIYKDVLHTEHTKEAKII